MRVFRADELDRAPGELDRARGGADVAGEPGGPGAEPGEVKPGEPGRVRHRWPQREHPLQVRVSLREAEYSLRWRGRFDGGASASAGRPAAAQCGASSAAPAIPLRASSPASHACSPSRSPGRIVA